MVPVLNSLVHLFLANVWAFTIAFGVWKILRPRVNSQLFTLSVLIICIAAASMLVENIYFGSMYSSQAGFLPGWIHEELSRPGWVVFPKIYTLLSSVVIVYLLVRHWIPSEENEISQNRSERSRLEESLTMRTRQLEESESQFKRIVENAPIPTCVFTEDGSIITVNKAWRDITGYSEEELRTLEDWTIRAYGDRSSAVRAAIQDLFELEQTKDEGEFTIRTNHGEDRIWDFSSAPIGRLPDGRRVVASMAHDVTAKRQAEKEAINVRTRFNAYAENSDDCFWSKDIVNGEFRTRYVSPAFTRIWGYDPQSLYRDPTFWLEAIVPEDRERAREVFERTVKTKAYATTTYRIIDARGGEAWIEDRMLPRLDASGIVLGIDGIARDITERVVMEQRLFHSQKVESLGTIAGGVAHDFNNLLTAIMGFASMLREPLRDSSLGREYLSEIELAAKRACELCDHLLAYAGKRKLSVESVNVGDIVEEITRIMRVSVPPAITIATEIDPHAPPIKADPTQIRQVMTNASESIGERGGSIRFKLDEYQPDEEAASRLSLQEGQDYLRVVVADNGVGMDSETKSRIFDPFYSTKFIGRGLGLAVVMGIVRGHDGAIEVESAPHQGSEFRLYFPALTAKVPASLH